MIIHSLEQATQSPMNDHGDCTNKEDWRTMVGEESVKKAETTMKYIIDEKFARMQPEFLVRSVMESDQGINTGRAILDSNPKYLTKFLKFKNTSVQASDVSQFRLMPHHTK